MGLIQPRRIIHYRKSNDYKRIHATGFWGGVHPSGELHFDIYEEVLPMPTQTRLIQDHNGIREEASGPISVERIVHIGVSMPMSAVPGLIKWLQKK